MINFLKIIFRYLFNKKDKNYNAPLQYEIEYEKNPLPPWEEIIEMCYDKQLGGYEDVIEKVIYSKSKDFRAIIFKTSTDIYTVSYEKLYPWDEEDEYEMIEYWSGGLPGYWGGFSTSAVSTNSFYDSLETAEKEIFSMPEFKGEDYEKKFLPPWEEIIEMCYDQGLSNLHDYTIEKVIYANIKDFRAVIYKKKDMYFIICERLYAWDEEDEYEINEYLSGKGLPGYWFPIDNGASVFDSIESAEKEIMSMSEFKRPKYKIYHRSYADMEEMYDDFKDYIRNIRLENNKIFIEHNEDVLVIEKGVNGSFYTYRNGEKEKGDWDDQDLLDYALEFVKLHCRNRG